MQRKGFPESYDVRALVAFVRDLKAGEDRVTSPVYSHLVYDIVPGETKAVIERPDIVIVEGLNVLQTGPAAGRASRACSSRTSSTSRSTWTRRPRTSARWYVERFLALRNTAFRDPASYFHRYAALSDEEAVETAGRIWAEINEPNLRANILPTRERADLVLRKSAGPRGRGSAAAKAVDGYRRLRAAVRAAAAAATAPATAAILPAFFRAPFPALRAARRVSARALSRRRLAAARLAGLRTAAIAPSTLRLTAPAARPTASAATVARSVFATFFLVTFRAAVFRAAVFFATGFRAAGMASNLLARSHSPTFRASASRRPAAPRRVVSATDRTISRPPATRPGVSGSPRTSAPRTTATTGLT